MLDVLVTNDDGYLAEGIRALSDALVEAGHRVTMVAPDSNRSATGHRVLIRESLLITDHGEQGGVHVLSCSGTPADCTRVGALSGLIGRPDVVVSGINHGVNLGDDIRYSGTVAAAVEAALLGIPALALSQQGPGEGVRFLIDEPDTFDHRSMLVDLVERFAPLAGRRDLLNVNVPHGNPDAELRWAALGTRRWPEVPMEVLEETPRTRTIRAWAADPLPSYEPESDFSVVREGDIAVSLLSARGSLTDLTRESSEALSSLGISAIAGAS